MSNDEPGNYHSDAGIAVVFKPTGACCSPFSRSGPAGSSRTTCRSGLPMFATRLRKLTMRPSRSPKAGRLRDTSVWCSKPTRFMRRPCPPFSARFGSNPGNSRGDITWPSRSRILPGRKMPGSGLGRTCPPGLYACRPQARGAAFETGTFSGKRRSARSAPGAKSRLGRDSIHPGAG